MRERIKARAHPEDRARLAATFGPPLPDFLGPKLLSEWERIVDAHGWHAGNDYARRVREELFPELYDTRTGTALPLDATRSEIADEAERMARDVRRRISPLATHPDRDDELLAELRQIAHELGVRLPSQGTTSGKLARMSEAGYWRRELRKRFERFENAAIRAGVVHSHASPIVSETALRRHRRDSEAIDAWLQDHVAVNIDTGETLDLAEVWASSPANPSMRFVMMVSVLKGLQKRAGELGFVPVFVTVTCPSRMHARHKRSGAENERFDGTSPRAAQAYLTRLWKNALRALDRESITRGADYFGVRVVEPNHDGTPHWHLGIFVRPEHVDCLAATLRRYSLADSPDEPGATEHRFQAERLASERGDMTGYMLKYISKATDGRFIDVDDESGLDGKSSAVRAIAWARLRRMRQFQFFGTGALAPYRELFRLTELPTVQGMPEHIQAVLEGLHAAARPVDGERKGGDFADFMRVRDAAGIELRTFRPPEPSLRYPGEETRRVRGLMVPTVDGSAPLVTRPDTWRIEQRAGTGQGDPWTRCNNGARLDPAAISAASARFEYLASTVAGAVDPSESPVQAVQAPENYSNPPQTRRRTRPRAVDGRDSGGRLAPLEGASGTASSTQAGRSHASVG